MKKLLLILFFLSINSIVLGQWIEIGPITTQSLISVSSSDNNTIWAGGDNWGLVLRSVNGGINWSSSNLPYYQNEAPGAVPHIYAIDSSTALVSVTGFYTILVYKTSDGGKSWNRVFLQVDGHINGIHFTSPTDGIMI